MPAIRDMIYTMPDDLFRATINGAARAFPSGSVFLYSSIMNCSVIVCMPHLYQCK